MKMLWLFLTKVKFVDSARFLASSLSNVADNFARRIHKTKLKDYNCFFQYESVNENLVNYKFWSCNKNYSKKINENLKIFFKNTFNFLNDISRFILLLRKFAYPYEFMDNSE